MRAEVDRDLCIGCGLCEILCPEVFELDEDIISTVIVEIIPEEAESCAQEAEEECPADAITIFG